jgi:isoleucyl-tRNA synthetase
MLDTVELQKRIQEFWDKERIFEKSVSQREGKKPFVFFDGPPTANGSPGIHHFIGRAFKDLFCRYKAMQGYFVLRKSGWDTHGLPVELEVEKELGFTNKKDIEAYGVAAYNAKCRESVWKYKSQWEHFVRQAGHWIDMKDPYITYETPYMESLWHVISQMHKRKLLYQAHRVVPFCTRCGTPLSSHEVAQGYKTVTDTSVYVKFRITKAPAKLKLPAGTSILAWTTTPWTLPGNVALAVGSDISYVLAERAGEYWIIAEDLAHTVLGAPLHIVRSLKGKDLVGIRYEPLFDVPVLKKSSSYRVYPASFVTTTDGTGVVHTAVMYGEDDYQLGTALKLAKHHTVTERGLFTGVGAELDGMHVKNAKTEARILDMLQEKGFLLKSLPYEHEYPHCWRCSTPLLYYAKESWFVRMSSLNAELLENNSHVNWIPGHLKDGRFGQWLREAKDWAFSRERYWGTPLPIWFARSKTGQAVGSPLVATSLADLDTYRAHKANTFILVRHGHSTRNSLSREHSTISSQLEADTYSLTEDGVQQAEMLARALKSYRVHAIYASPFMRTQETAAILARTLKKKVVTDERLGELQYGSAYEGKTLSSVQNEVTRHSFTDKPEGGESWRQCRARMTAFFKEVNAQFEGKTIVVVSHGDPLWAARTMLRGMTEEQAVAQYDTLYPEFAVAYEETMHNWPYDEHGNVDLHRPYIDDVVLKRGGKHMTRVPDLCDVWFDSGAMPYAQWHWPFEGDAIFKQQFPADLIVEAIDQTRGWFYTLIAIATTLGLKAPYKNVVSYGHVLDEKGMKMSKSKGNVVKPQEVIDAVGTDAARWYFYTINAPGDSKNFAMADVRARLTGFLGTLHNCLRFYQIVEHGEDQATGKERALDRWLSSRLNRLIRDVTERMNAYDTMGSARAIEQFVVDDLSQWWLRRSRKYAGARAVLGSTLRVVSLMLAPYVPFFAEDLWHHVRTSGDPISVHLADWPPYYEPAINDALEASMVQLRSYITAGLALRKEAQLKVRQPLADATFPHVPFEDGLEELACEELNVKQILYDASAAVTSLNTALTPELVAEGFVRDCMRSIQDMRKEAGLEVGDRAYCQWQASDPNVASAIRAFRDDIMRDTGLSGFMEQKDDKTFSVETTTPMGSGQIWLGLRKS